MSFFSLALRCSLTAFRRSDVLYAFGLGAGHLQYNTVEDSAILVTVTQDLRIVVSASPTGPAVYIDVPLENIQHTTIESVWEADSQAYRYAVIIELSQAVENAWYHNAVGYNGSTISIAFTSQSHAKILSELLQQPKKAGMTGRPTVMESQPINCSEPKSDGELARPNLALTDSQRLAGVALQANSLLGQYPSPGMLRNNNAALPSTSQDGIINHVSEPGLEAEIHQTTQGRARSASAIQGIDVSQVDRAKCGKTDSDIQNSTAHADGPAIETPLPAGTIADVGFEESPGQRTEGSTQQDQPSKSQDQGYDSSYDISPRISRIQPKSKDNAVSMVQPKHLRPPGSNKTMPATNDGPSEKHPSSKLSRSLRNNDGNVEAGAESPSTLELERTAGTLMKDITTSKPSAHDEVAPSAKSKFKFLKSHLTKKAKESEGKEKAPKEKDREHIEDEYDLPSSPKSPVRKLEASMIQDKASSQAPDRVSRHKPKPKKPVKAAKLPSSLPSRRLGVQSRPEDAPKPSREKGVRPAKPGVNKVTGNGITWDIEMENSGEDDEAIPKVKTNGKHVAKKPVRHSKQGKPKKIKTQPKKIASQASGEYATKAKPAADLTEPRSRRAAALIANKKIQGLEGSDQIVDEVEESVSMSGSKPATTTNKQETQPSTTEIPEEKVLEHAERVQASVNGNAENRVLSCQDTVPTIRPDEDANSEASSVENVELVSTTTRHGVAQAGKPSKTSLPPPNPALSEAHGTSSHRDGGRGVTGVNINDVIHDRSPEEQNPGKPIIPESMTKNFDAASEKEGESIIEPNLGKDEEVRPLGMVGDAEDSHFQEAMPDIEPIDRQENRTIGDEISDSGNKTATGQMEEGHSRIATKEVHGTRKAIQHAHQTSIKSEKSKAIAGVSKERDPFEAKLSLLTSDNQATTSTVKERARPHPKQIPKASKKYYGGQHQVAKGEAVRSAEQVNDSGRVTQLETQDDVGVIQQQKDVSINANSGLNEKAQAQQRPQKDQEHMKQLVQTEQEQNVGLTQPQQAVSKPNSLRLPVAAVGNKRKGVLDGGAREKRPKLAPSNEQMTQLHGKHDYFRQATGDATSISAKGKQTQIMLKEMQPPDINRKPEIIDFSAEGPKNQGTASTKKPKPLKISTGMHADDSNQAAPRKEQEILKRKAASGVDDLAPSAYEQPPKRQKRNITPPTKHKHVPLMIAEPNPIAVHGKPHRVSSQSTRVEENGSPMPSVHARNERVAYTQGDMKDEEMVDPDLHTDLHTEDEQCVSYADGGDRQDDPFLPLTKVPPPPPGHNAGFDRSSSNSKRNPDSPNAPSNSASMPAHYIFHDGTIVNPRTKENIVPIEPQDPFIGAGQVGASDFMRALRRKSDTEVRSQDDLLSDKKTAINAKRRLPANTEDPDKTLVEEELPRKQRKYDVISVSSTITSSSSGSAASERLSPSIEASSQDSDVNTLARWRKAFEPHQGNMLGVLSNISHVSKVNVVKE